ncbi:SAP domain-containing ribonucleoprotein [Spodoptera litura]|uniref:SAP domain-containing ribonucleoprotein n=1 Tax=Spodoptera litura TaxID=69820 RepID=A0A9J7EVN6_SPOLT|nr:SAP domain-containing ribonucleoprotein [Spodoptera litura]
MADSTVTDVTKMKVVDLRKELKSRGLSYTGDKAELVARLQAAMSQDEHGDINLDSDEIDSDGVLEDEDDKSQGDILDDNAVDTLNEELALSEQPSPVKTTPEAKPPRTLKRRITSTEISKEKTEDNKSTESKESASKKIVLNRAISITSTSEKSVEDKDAAEAEINPTSNKIKITADLDTKTRLEMRAKRFGLPVKMSEDERKEARKQRFGQTVSAKSTAISNSGTSVNLEKFKKRAERFGQSVSKIMTDIENQEKLAKRKAKFGGSA